MNNKELKKIIRKATYEKIPDITSKIDISQIEIAKDDVFSSKSKINVLFPRIMAFSSFSILVAIVVSISYSFLGGHTEIVDNVLVTEAETFGFPVVTSFSLLDSKLVNQNLKTKQGDGKPHELSILDKIDSLNRYVNMFEVAIGDKDNLDYQILPIQDGDFAYEMSYSTKNLLEQSVNYTCKFNQTPIQNENGKYSVEGVMSSNSVNYDISGQLTKTEENEISSIRSSLDENNYVEIEESIVDSKKYYNYQIWEDGLLTNESNMNLTMSNKKVQANVVESDGDASITYKIEKKIIESDIEIISIEFQFNDGNNPEKGKIEVQPYLDPLTGKYAYAYTIKSNKNDTSWEGYRHEYGKGNDNRPF